LIIDTDGLSAMADGDAKLEPLLRQAPDIAIPVIVLGEYKYGIGQSRSRVRYERWLVEVVASCRVLAVDEGTAEHYAEIRGELKTRGAPDTRERSSDCSAGTAARPASAQPGFAV
jgi:tRNA(fMet)-specific endonuclease VapC